MSIRHLTAKIRTRFNCYHEKFHRFDEEACRRLCVVSSLTPSPEESALIEEWTSECSDFLDRSGTADTSLTVVLALTILRNKPSIVVETGVWHGVSSFFALKALRHNGRGHLISIDLPPFRSEFRVMIGAAVPESLRDQWTLMLGPSTDILGAISSKIDVFCHDSEHTYRNMLQEYILAWKRISPGGILLSDDIHTNRAFLDFAPEDADRKLVYPRKKGGFVGQLGKVLD